MAETDGQGKTRLDRIEEMIERHIVANEEAHASFIAEHKMLLTAQVIFQDSLQQLEIRQAETSEKIDALIKIVDEWIRNNPRPSP